MKGYIDSPAFGPSKIPTQEQDRQLSTLISTHPHVAFARLNKILRKRGMMLSIDKDEEPISNERS